MRIFAAIRPPEPVLDHVEAALAPVRASPGQRLRWVRPEDWHVTIAFHGEVPDGAVPDAADALAATVADSDPMDLTLRGAGSFGGRTLWIGVSGATAGDERGLRDLMARCSADGFAQPQERHRAHLTVARASRRSADVDLGSLARVLSVYRGPSWRAAQVELLASELGAGPGGRPRYTTIAEIPFASLDHPETTYCPAPNTGRGPDLEEF